jgi:uncharacterized protein
MPMPGQTDLRSSMQRVLGRVAALSILSLWLGSAPAAGLDYRLVSIATAGRTGVYYFAGGTICGFVNAHRWAHGIRCIAEPTNGSIDNLRAVRSGRQSFGIVQSDWQFHAVTGGSVFEAAGPDQELRSLFSLFPEPFTVVARPDSGIASFTDLSGKRISIGPQGSGGRATMNVVMGAMGWTETDFAFVADLPMDALPGAICSGEIDAAVFIVAHPNLTVDELMTECSAHLVPMQELAVDALVATHPEYSRAEITGGTYTGQPTGIPTFALAATMVASARTSPVIVETLVRSVFENLDTLRAAHPAFADLDPAAMTSEGLTAPLHDAARKYFEDAGLLPRPATLQEPER